MKMKLKCRILLLRGNKEPAQNLYIIHTTEALVLSVILQLVPETRCSCFGKEEFLKALGELE